jgi:hypothetical protein
MEASCHPLTPTSLRPLSAGHRPPVRAGHPPSVCACRMAPPRLSVPHLYTPLQKAASVPPQPPPPPFAPHSLLHRPREHTPPLPSASRPLQLTGATSSQTDMAAVQPLTRPPGELCPHRHYLSLEPYLTFPSSSCRTAGISSQATGASPPPQNEATHSCHRPPHHRPAASVSSAPYDLAPWVAGLTVVLSAPPESHWQARPGRATVMAVDSVIMLRARCAAPAGTGRPGHCAPEPG